MIFEWNVILLYYLLPLKCKNEKLTSLGAELVYHGTDCEETEKAARGMSSSRVQYVSPYNDLDVIAGPEIQKGFSKL